MSDSQPSELVTTLQQQSFFRGFTDDEIACLAASATAVEFNRGAYLCHEGEEAHHFYIVREGKLAIEILPPHKHTIVLQTIDAGDVFGWSWLSLPFRWAFSGRALTALKALRINGKAVQQQCEADPVFGYKILKSFTSMMTHRLQMTRLQLLDVYSKE